MASSITTHQEQVLALMESMTEADQARAVRMLAQLLTKPGAPEATNYLSLPPAPPAPAPAA